jgi:CelD/BcsL family acetyltransferase involved in cellulose biosynthesis
MRCTLVALRDYPDLATDWVALQACTSGSPFNAWPWVSTWLELLPARIRVLAIRCEDASGVVALGLLVIAPEHGVNRLFGRESLYLQETGDAELDEITIEYSGLLVRDGCEGAAYAAMFEALSRLPARWRRLRLSTSQHGAPILDSLPASLRAECVDTRPSYYVDLAGIDAKGGYMAALGRDARSVVRRTLRAYEAEGGALRVDVARDGETAGAWFDALERLHTRRWNARGKSGAFASAHFRRFHDVLLAQHAADGFCRMTRVSAGDLVVGYLYNLAWKGSIFYYNSGLAYGLLARHDRPGVACMYAVIEHAAAEGCAEFDFLAGEQEYKRRLATRVRRVHSIDVRREGLRSRAELALLRLARRRTVDVPLSNALQQEPLRGT